ncbi:hypothetical protein [Streptomyces sp. NPDC001380]|uniref:hypothetical protein n=1 Tax=Streptomyces sp. NPDC001380 TaxID=3364566 RepID=UPI0036902CFF
MPGRDHGGRADRDGALHAALHAEASRHAPDREYILRRVRQAQREGRPEEAPLCASPPARREPEGDRPEEPDRWAPRRPPGRASGAAAALGALLLAGGAAAWAAAEARFDDRPSIRISDGPLAPPPAAPVTRSAAPGGGTTGPAPDRTGGAAPPPADGRQARDGGPGAGTEASAPLPVRTVPDSGPLEAPAWGTADPGAADPAAPGAVPAPDASGAAVEDRFLRAAGAVDPHSTDTWEQGDVTVTTDRALRSLRVEVRIARTAGVAAPTTWTGPGPDAVGTAVEESGSEIVYRFTLRGGTVLQPGAYVFAVRFDHARGARDPGQDRWTASASAVDGTAGSASVHGVFR